MIDKIKNVLTEWTINFVNHNATIKNNFQKIEKNKDDLKAIYDDREVCFIIKPFIDNFDDLFEKIEKDKYISVVLFNTIENLDIILNKWKRLVDFNKLTLYFVNMFSNTETKWIVKPYLHDKITDEKTLKIGLRSMFSMVEPITKEMIERKVL
jgi:hypothetical protein